MEKENRSLYIPINVRRRIEIAEGFGKEEVLITLCGLIIGLIIGIAGYFIQNKDILYLVFTPVFTGAITAFSVKKDKFNSSIIDNLKEIIAFSRTQKQYFYQYKDSNVAKEDCAVERKSKEKITINRS